MKLIRAIDLAAQVVIIVLLIAAAIEGEGFGFGALFGILGIWQLVSALINTYFFYKHSLSVKIQIYWSAALISLILVFSGISESISTVGMFCSAVTAIWYIIILINLIKIVNKESKAIEDSKTKL